MKVSIKSFFIKMDIKNNGVEFEVRDPRGAFQGDFILTKTELIWCQGKTLKENGKSVSWDEFIKWMNDR